MKRFFSAQRTGLEGLGAETIDGIHRSIDRTNWHRLRYFFGLTMAYELLLMAMVDLPALSVAQAGDIPPGPGAPMGAGEEPSLPLSFLACHLGIFLTSALGLVRALRDREGHRPALATAAPGLYAAMVLVFLGVITGLDQLRGGDINAFAINILVAAVLIYLRPPVNLLVFTPGFLLMFAGVLILQADPELRLANLVNGGIFYSAVLLLSAYLYNNQFSQLAKSGLLEQANARIRELSARDELTGLYNRRALVEVIERDLTRMRREERSAFVAIADVDHFKVLNDTAETEAFTKAYSRADAALYAAKAGGRNRVVGP